MARVMLFFTILCLQSGCKQPSDKVNKDQDGSDRKIARVFDRDIYLSELAPYISKDSTFMASAYINKIVQEEVIVKKANEKGLASEEIESRVNQFRNSLMMIEFRNDYLKNNIDTNISENDLKTYYEQNSKNFILPEDIFKGYFIQIPLNTPRIEKLKQLIESKKPIDFQELKSFCLRYANFFIINTYNWTRFPHNPETIKNISAQNILEFMRSRQVITHQKEDHLYLVRLFDYKHAGLASPFEYCKQEIRMLVLNKRKMQTWSKYTENLLREAKSNNNVEIYK